MRAGLVELPVSLHSSTSTCFLYGRLSKHCDGDHLQYSAEISSVRFKEFSLPFTHAHTHTCTRRSPTLTHTQIHACITHSLALLPHTHTLTCMQVYIMIQNTLFLWQFLYLLPVRWPHRGSEYSDLY